MTDTKARGQAGGEAPLAALSLWANQMHANGDLAGVCVSGSLATGETLWLGPEDTSDCDLFIFSGRASRDQLLRSLHQLNGVGAVHSAWYDCDESVPIEANFGTALVRDRQLVLPASQTPLLERFPHWGSVPPFEAVRLLWNRWSELLFATVVGSDTRRARVKIGCDVATVALYSRGSYAARSADRLELLRNEAGLPVGGLPASQAALRVRSGTASSEEIPSAAALAVESAGTIEMIVAPVAYEGLVRMQLPAKHWSRAWVRTLYLARAAGRTLSAIKLLVAGEDPRLRAMVSVFQFVSDGARDPEGALRSSRALRDALQYWRIENRL